MNNEQRKSEQKLVVQCSFFSTACDRVLPRFATSVSKSAVATASVFGAALVCRNQPNNLRHKVGGSVLAASFFGFPTFTHPRLFSRSFFHKATWI